MQQRYTTGTVNGGSTNIVSWNWTFGDASSSNLQNPQHTYVPGTYNWVLTATDGSGCSATDTGTIVVGSPPPPFSLNDTTSCGPIKIGAPSTYVRYQWYNNGTIIPGATDSTYLAVNSGNYSVTVMMGMAAFQSTPMVIIQSRTAYCIECFSTTRLFKRGDITVNSNTSGNVTVTGLLMLFLLRTSRDIRFIWSNVPPGLHGKLCDHR
jgi:PKD repeat protein